MNYYIDNSQSINKILEKMNEFDTLYLKNGVYHEKVKVTKNNITIIGEGKDTIISYNDYYSKVDDNNFEYITIRTYSMIVVSDNVTLKNLTVRNECNNAKIYAQAVALEVIGDDFKAYNINLIGDQDTLLSGPITPDLLERYKAILPSDELKGCKSHQLYDNCYIEGGVDYIFGAGISYFNHCHLHSINNGYIAAPSHLKDLKYGYVFNECLITASSNVTNVCIARPWREYGYAAFINCKYSGSFLNKELVSYWKIERKDTCRFYQYNSFDTSKALSILHNLDKKDIIKFTQDEVLNS